MRKRRTTTTDRKADYAVGYGKPPVETRFKKGNRAAGRGRLRVSGNLTTLLLEALEKRVLGPRGAGRLPRGEPRLPTRRPASGSTALVTRGGPTSKIQFLRWQIARARRRQP
jgi:hypothetical protein